jgi:mRNA-degrading endonuclease toxin of MazEF toxin-antitoxin module
MKAGTGVISDFPGVVSSKRRPSVVVSSKTYYQEHSELILALITTNIGKATSATDYILQYWSSANLNRPSAVRIFLFTLPESEITKIGNLSERDWAEVRKRLQISIAV